MFGLKNVVKFNRRGTLLGLNMHLLIFFSYQRIVKAKDFNEYLVIFKMKLNMQNLLTDYARQTVLGYRSESSDIKKPHVYFIAISLNNWYTASRT